MNLGEMTQEDFTALMQKVATDAVAAGIKDMGLDKEDQKYIIIPKEDAGGKDEKEQLALKNKERLGLLAKAIWTKDFSEASRINAEIKNADPNNMTTNADGGYLVPDTTAAEIIGLIPTFGQARALVDVGTFPQNIDNLVIPKRGTGMTVYYPGENASITTSKFSLDMITLLAKKAAGLAVLTNELKAFATVDFVNYILTRAAEAFGADEDAKVFAKVNTVFTGIFYPSNSFGDSSNVDPNNLTFEDIIAPQYALDPKYLLNASYTMHRTMVEQVRYIKDGMQRPIFIDANASGVPTLAGRPVNVVENAPALADLVAGDPCIIYGNLKNSMLKDKAGMRIDTATDGVVDSTSLFQNDLTAIRFIRHWSFHPGLVEGYVALKKA